MRARAHTAHTPTHIQSIMRVHLTRFFSQASTAIRATFVCAIFMCHIQSSDTFAPLTGLCLTCVVYLWNIHAFKFTLSIPLMCMTYLCAWARHVCTHMSMPSVQSKHASHCTSTIFHYAPAYLEITDIKYAALAVRFWTLCARHFVLPIAEILSNHRDVTSARGTRSEIWQDWNSNQDWWMFEAFNPRVYYRSELDGRRKLPHAIYAHAYASAKPMCTRFSKPCIKHSMHSTSMCTCAQSYNPHSAHMYAREHLSSYYPHFDFSCCFSPVYDSVCVYIYIHTHTHTSTHTHNDTLHASTPPTNAQIY